MIEFFDSIWNWIVSNRGNVIAFVTSTDFILTATSLFALFKNIKSMRQNTLSVDTVNSTINNNNNMVDDVKETKESGKVAVEKISECERKVEEVNTKMEAFEKAVIDKLNSMFELYSVVYSTIKDDNIRNAANSILIKAKHNDDITKADLEKQIEELKHKVAEKVNDVNSMVNETVDVLKDSVTGTIKEVKNNIKRY